MNPLLEKYLKKRGIESITELDADEREVFDNWDNVLTNVEITAESMRAFCQAQLDIIDSLWDNLDNSDQKNGKLTLLRIVYRKLIILIDSNKSKKAEVEAQITALLHKG